MPTMNINLFSRFFHNEEDKTQTELQTMIDSLRNGEVARDALLYIADTKGHRLTMNLNRLSHEERKLLASLLTRDAAEKEADEEAKASLRTITMTGKVTDRLRKWFQETGWLNPF
jgi:hypothetical protein